MYTPPSGALIVGPELRDVSSPRYHTTEDINEDIGFQAWGHLHMYRATS